MPWVHERKPNLPHTPCLVMVKIGCDMDQQMYTLSHKKARVTSDFVLNTSNN